jgi:hypothetical protein
MDEGTMKSADKIGELDIYVWEGEVNLLNRIALGLSGTDINIVRADEITTPSIANAAHLSVAMISTNVVGKYELALREHRIAAAMPVIWVGALPHARKVASFSGETIAKSGTWLTGAA